MTANAAALGASGRGEIAAAARAAGDLELPRPLRLLLTAGWNLTESVGLHPETRPTRSVLKMFLIGSG